MAGRVSCIVTTPSRPSRLNAACIQKMSRQLPQTSTSPPSSGAISGATPITSMRIDSIRADWSRPYRSRTIARASTGAAQAPKAWTKRQKIICSTLADSAQPAEPSRYSTMPAITGPRLP